MKGFDMPINTLNGRYGKKEGRFTPQDYGPMREVLNQGDSVLIAAHKPSRNNQLEKGGYGAVYLQAITEGSVIVPITVSIEK